MFKKKVVDSPYCQIFLEGEESVIHALWTCLAALDIWNQCSKKIQKSSLIRKTFMKFLEDMGSDSGNEIFGGNSFGVQKTAAEKKCLSFNQNSDILMQWCSNQKNLYRRSMKAQKTNTVDQSGSTNSTDQRWTPPMNTYKIN